MPTRYILDTIKLSLFMTLILFAAVIISSVLGVFLVREGVPEVIVLSIALSTLVILLILGLIIIPKSLLRAVRIIYQQVDMEVGRTNAVNVSRKNPMVWILVSSIMIIVILAAFVLYSITNLVFLGFIIIIIAVGTQVSLYFYNQESTRNYQTSKQHSLFQSFLPPRRKK